MSIVPSSFGVGSLKTKKRKTKKIMTHDQHLRV